MLTEFRIKVLRPQINVKRDIVYFKIWPQMRTIRSELFVNINVTNVHGKHVWILHLIILSIFEKILVKRK